MELMSVASSGNVMITNAAVSPTGRLFGNFPRWTDVPTPSVGEATPNGDFKPFPGGVWNEWQPAWRPTNDSCAHMACTPTATTTCGSSTTRRRITGRWSKAARSS
jgi:hypothetical protein